VGVPSRYGKLFCRLPHVKKKKLFETDRQAGRQTDGQTKVHCYICFIKTATTRTPQNITNKKQM
jgi:hypothetical protein